MPATNTTPTPADLIRRANALLLEAVRLARESCTEDESTEIFNALGETTYAILDFEAGETAIETAISLRNED